MRFRARRVPVGGLKQDGSGEAYGDVDPENPTPAGMLSEEGAQDGANDGGGAPAPGEDALDGRALLEVVDVRGNGERRRLQRSGTKTLQHAKANELRHGLGKAAEDGPEQEDAQPAEKGGPPADAIGQAPGNEHAQGGG